MFEWSITFLCMALIAGFAGFVGIPYGTGAAIAQQVFIASLLLFAAFALAELFGVGDSGWDNAPAVVVVPRRNATVPVAGRYPC